MVEQLLQYHLLVCIDEHYRHFYQLERLIHTNFQNVIRFLIEQYYQCEVMDKPKEIKNLLLINFYLFIYLLTKFKNTLFIIYT